jgi:transposase-like protein
MCLNSIWYRSEEPNDGWQINEEWHLSEVSYADDITLIGIVKDDTQHRLRKLGDTSKDTATLQISLPKTFRMVVKQSEHITPTSNSESNGVAKVHCKVCGRGFLNNRGVSAHKRFCWAVLRQRQPIRGKGQIRN